MLPEFEQKVLEIRKDIIDIGEILKKALEVSRDSAKKHSKNKPGVSLQGEIKHLKYIAQSVDNNILLALVMYKSEANRSKELVVMLKITHELLGIFEALRKYSKSIQGLLRHDNSNISAAAIYVSNLQGASIRSLASVIECFKTFTTDDALHFEAKARDEILIITQKELLLENLKDHRSVLKSFEIIKALKEYERIIDNCENIVKLIDSTNENDSDNLAR
jgi:hypothetical protein